MVSGGRFLAAVGVATVAAGVAVLLVPGLAESVGLSSTDAVVTALAVLALVQGIGAVASRVRGRRRAASLPEVEKRLPAPVPGDEFDAELAALPGRGPEERDRVRASTRERLESVAVRVLARRGLDESTARRHLRAGTWTADEPAAAFFLPPAERELALGARIRTALGAEHAFQRRARRTAAAIAAHADGEVPLPDAEALEAAEDRPGGALADTGTTGATGNGSAGTTGTADAASPDGGRSGTATGATDTTDATGGGSP